MIQLVRKVFDSWEDLFFDIQQRLNKRHIRLVIGIVVIMAGLLFGLNCGSTIPQKVIFGIFGMIAPIIYYLITIMFIQRPGFIEEIQALWFGLLTGIAMGTGFWSQITELTFSLVIAVAVLGGSIGLIWTKLNIVYYCADESE